MSTVDDAVAGRTPLGSTLKAGVDTLSLNQKITFELYRRVALPLDGFVFWVRSGAPASSAVYNAMVFNTATYNQSEEATATTTLTVMGSLHYATNQAQEEDATYAINRVVFTAENPVTDFNQIAPDELYIASFDGIRFAFSARGSYYKQSNLHHYVGNAIYSVMDTQVIDNPALLNVNQLIVSNSLPAWLALNNYNPPYPTFLPRVRIPLFSSYLSPSNLPPPYGTVHIDPETTEGIAAAPTLGPTMTHDQFTRERVTLTLYGVNNDVALTLLDNISQYTLDTARFGISNIPIVLDDKRTQSELSVIAMKKRIRFDVNYYQSSMRNIARQLIVSALLDPVNGILISDAPLPPPML